MVQRGSAGPPFQKHGPHSWYQFVNYAPGDYHESHDRSQRQGNQPHSWYQFVSLRGLHHVLPAVRDCAVATLVCAGAYYLLDVDYHNLYQLALHSRCLLHCLIHSSIG